MRILRLVEFAVASTFLFTLIFGILEFCLVVYAGAYVAFAAQQGTRYAMVRGADWTSACASAESYGCQATADNVKNHILNMAHPGLNLTAGNIEVTWPARGTCAEGSNAQGCQVQVTVRYTFQMNLPFYSPSIPLSSISKETIQD
jgi:Flp pilus assembly protein TadG